LQESQSRPVNTALKFGLQKKVFDIYKCNFSRFKKSPAAR